MENIREINDKIESDNCYYAFAYGNHGKARIIKARNKAGKLEGLLMSGEWISANKIKFE